MPTHNEANIVGVGDVRAVSFCVQLIDIVSTTPSYNAAVVFIIIKLCLCVLSVARLVVSYSSIPNFANTLYNVGVERIVSFHNSCGI